MGELSKIEWTTHTFNPWIGCAKVSPACKHCYAEVSTPARTSRARGLELWGEKAARYETSADNWKKMRRLHAKAAAAGVRERVFCGSLMDVYERPGTDDAQGLLALLRLRLWVLIEETPFFDWLLLTKRPENAHACTPTSWWVNGFPPNVWQGFTAEDKPHFLERWEHAQKIPADVRFVSYEPALGPLDLPDEVAGKLHWGIVGSESGHGARRMKLEWVERFVDRCWNLGVHPFVKQIANEYDRKGGDPQYWPKSPWGDGSWPREFPQ